MEIKYGISVHGSLLEHVVFIGDDYDNYKEHIIVPLLFDNENHALEVSKVIANSTVVEVKNNLLVA